MVVSQSGKGQSQGRPDRGFRRHTRQAVAHEQVPVRPEALSNRLGKESIPETTVSRCEPGDERKITDAQDWLDGPALDWR